MNALQKSIFIILTGIVFMLNQFKGLNGATASQIRTVNKPPLRLIPINVAEAIIEPFWDPALSGFNEWEIKLGEEYGLRVWQNWCWVGFEWLRAPADGVALEMSRRLQVDCQAYNRLLVSIVVPEKALFKIMVQTDKGSRFYETLVTGTQKKEYAVALEGGNKIEEIKLLIRSTAGGVQQGWINWIGLQDSHLLAAHLSQWQFFDANWEGYLKPVTYEPTFKPTQGLIFSAAECDQLRSLVQQIMASNRKMPLLEMATTFRERVPEKFIGEYVIRTDQRFNREREHDQVLIQRPGEGYQLAVTAIVLKDKNLLRLAARYALSIAACEHWDESFLNNFPGSTWNHRCFSESICAFETALILDLAGELFTPLGRNFLLRRLAEEGLGTINYNVWKYDYIFHNNQLCWFSKGRMAAALVLEQEWPRVRSQTEQAYQDILESLEKVILSDGGYLEGPGYFQSVIENCGLALFMYARARNQVFSEILPPVLQKTSQFAAAIVSTDDQQDVIPICDSKEKMRSEVLALLATVLPHSYWTTIWKNQLTHSPELPDTFLSLFLSQKLPENTPPLPAFVFLPEMGILATTRCLENEVVKILILGNQAGAGHAHEDKGSFVLEFAGETFAMDPGICAYADPLHLILKHCQRHNMLVPFGTTQRAAPENPLPVDVKPVGTGDSLQFQATIDATPGWEEYYHSWRRTWFSSQPSELLIQDDYVLKQGEGVEFLWNTRLPVSVEEKQVTIHGHRGRVTLKVPSDCEVRIEELPAGPLPPQRRIAIQKYAQSGQIKIKVTLTVY